MSDETTYRIMSERRYTEQEVAAIFERAAEAQQTDRRHLSPGDGMTLAELQEIGREVGIPAELVAQAARSLVPRTPTTRRFLGLPLGVGRTVELGRRLSDEEWERLVVDLRETFDARGKVRYDGPFRQWTNGNLQALLEPTPTGQRLRLRTTNGNARGLMAGGVAMVGLSVASVIAAVVGAKLGDPGTVTSVVFMATIGVGLFGAGAARLPAWARRRRDQMDGVAARLALAAGDDFGGEVSGEES